jgi:hypothetical protein
MAALSFKMVKVAVLRRLSQEDGEFEFNLGYILYLKNTHTHKNER